MWMPSSSEKELLRRLYVRIAETVDRLPYTRSFDRIYEDFRHSSGTTPDRSEFWHALTNMRKRAELPRKKR